MSRNIGKAPTEMMTDPATNSGLRPTRSEYRPTRGIVTIAIAMMAICSSSEVRGEIPPPVACGSVELT